MSGTPEAVSTRGMKNQVRIRGPKPDVCFHAKGLDEMETLLKDHIEKCKDKAIPDTVYAQFLFDDTVTFHIKDTSDGIRDHFQHMQAPQYKTGPVPLPVTEAVSQVGDTKLKLRRQRAVGRAILRSISDVDGFNYFEKEAWDTKHADGYRFKYLCKDSYQNKDRAVNKSRKSTDAVSFAAMNNGNGTPRGSNSGTPAAQPPPSAADSGDQSPTKNGGAEVSEWFKKHGLTPPAAESPTRIPTYDCKGSIFVKFSSSQNVVDVVYQHMPVHNSSNERAPDPIPEKVPGGRASLPIGASTGTPHDDSGDPMDTTELTSYATPQQANTPTTNHVPILTEPATSKPAAATKKRKRTSTKPARESMVEAETSDLEMLDDDNWDQANQAPPPPLIDFNFEPDPGDADLWRPSVVTLVPGLNAMAKQPAKKGGAGAHAASKAQQSTAFAAEDSSASGSDFESGPSTSKAKAKKKVTAKPKTMAVKKIAAAAGKETDTTATSGAEKGGGSNDKSHSSMATKVKSSSTSTSTPTSTKAKATPVTKKVPTDPAEMKEEEENTRSDMRSTRKRTKTGCLICRSRKLKCDEVRPSCGHCGKGRPPRKCVFPEGEEGEGEGVEDDLSEMPLS